MEESVFVIEFYSKSKDSPPTIVWSNDILYTEMFIKQHNLDPMKIKRYVIPGCDVPKSKKLKVDSELLKFKIKSNFNPNVQTLISSDEILDIVTRDLCEDFVDSLQFGGLVTRNDIAFVSDMMDTIEDIDYASICDWELIDDDAVDRYYDDYYLNDEPPPQIPPPSDTSYVYDEIFDARSKHEILPFTIEAYVHYFVSSIMEVD